MAPLAFFYNLVAQNGLKLMLESWLLKNHPASEYFLIDFEVDHEKGIISYIEPMIDGQQSMVFYFTTEFIPILNQEKIIASKLIYDQIWYLPDEEKYSFVNKVIGEIDYLIKETYNQHLFQNYAIIAKILIQFRTELEQEKNRLDSHLETSLYHNSVKLGPKKTKSPKKSNAPEVFRYKKLKADPDSLVTLFNGLVEGEYIGKYILTENDYAFREDFLSIFGGKELKSPIRWLKGERALAYLIQSLVNQKKIEKRGQYYLKHWQITENCFRDENGNSFDVPYWPGLARSKKKLSKEDQDFIDDIVSKLP